MLQKNIIRKRESLMEQNEKIAAIAERDRSWAEIREHEHELAELVKAILDPSEITPSNFILFSQAIALVLTEITIFEDDFSIDDPSDSGTVKKVFLRMMEEIGYMKTIGDEDLSNEKRLEAVSQLRHSMWEGIANKKNDIISLMAALPEIKEDNHFILTLQCVSMVGLELELKNKELALLGLDDFPEK